MSTPTPATTGTVVQTTTTKMTPTSDTQGVKVMVKCPTLDAITIKFSPTAKASDMTDYSLKILKDILFKACIKSATISSTARDSANQARVMYDNLIGTGPKQGEKEQRNLYKGRDGIKVIDVYVELAEQKKSREEIIGAMKQKIEELGPENVSKHASDPKVYNVFDVAPSSISKKEAFEAAVRKDPRVTRFITPKKGDPGYHFEITQPK